MDRENLWKRLESLRKNASDDQISSAIWSVYLAKLEQLVSQSLSDLTIEELRELNRLSAVAQPKPTLSSTADVVAAKQPRGKKK